MNVFMALTVLAIVTPCANAAVVDSLKRDTVYTYKYRVTLKDKDKSAFSVRHPEEFLSQRAIERRRKQKLKIDKTDLPVNANYVSGISATGVEVLLTSKWNNTVLVECSDTTLMNNVSSLSYVTSIRKVASYKSVISDNEETIEQKKEKRIHDFKSIELLPDSGVTSVYGKAYNQINLLNGISLHDSGYQGKGIVVAVVDGGFWNVDLIPALKDAKILGTRDFVNKDSDIYGESSHGLSVFSCMAMNVPNVMIGTAPEASYWLLRSEDSETEQLVEEDYWASAVEFADSVGVDVINTSLGYTVFNNKADNVLYSEQDGQTHLVSKTASMLASKGIVLCCSAGNEGNKTWKRIGVPADAKDILAVGAVDFRGVNALFSSLGNSYDGRIKPDVMSKGLLSTVVGYSGNVSTANGTSFASPILCGMVACLWQALPDLTAYEIMDIVRKSGNNVSHPDNVFGYGIPDFKKALELGRNIK